MVADLDVAIDGASSRLSSSTMLSAMVTVPENGVLTAGGGDSLWASPILSLPLRKSTSIVCLFVSIGGHVVELSSGHVEWLWETGGDGGFVLGMFDDYVRSW
jgi:hypothetical protein